MIKQRLFLFFLPLLLALPFLNRAYFVDDHYFVEIATWLKDNPLHPYDFRTDDAGPQNPGWEKNGFVRMVNPLVHHYYLALLLKTGVTQEWFLRLGVILLSCFSAVFLFELARRWLKEPLWSTVLILVTPVFWMSSYSLLIDSTLLFFFLSSLYFYIRSIEKNSLFLNAVSGIFMGLTVLSKYPGALIFPLTMAWLFLNRHKTKQIGKFTVAWIIGLGMLVAWSLWTAHLYGRAHILAASDRMVNPFGMSKVLVFFVFMSGASLLPVLSWFFISGLKRIVLALLGIVCFCLFASSYGGFSFLQSFLLSLWFMTSFVFLISVFQWLSLSQFKYDRFLLIWIFGFVGMMLFVMDWVAVRYFAIVIPALVFAIIRLFELFFPKTAFYAIRIMTVCVFVTSASLAYADYKQASPSRDVGYELKKNGFLGGERCFYLGDSFTMSYLKEEGWTPYFDSIPLQVGDKILAKEVTMPLMWFFRKPIILKPLAEFNYPSRFPIKVMDYRGSAGFYASVWGALPFTFSSGPWERFRLFEVVGFQEKTSS